MSREDSHASNTDQIFNKTTEEIFPKLRKDMPIEMQEANTTPSRQGQKRNFVWNITVKAINIKNKERVFKATRENSQFTNKGKSIRIMAIFSM